MKPHALHVLALGLAASLAAIPAHATKQSGSPLEAIRAARARAAITELDVVAAHGILDGADAADPAIAVELARLALYEGDYDRAAQILARPDLPDEDLAELANVSRGCARSMAGALVIRDEERGVIVRLQDDADRPLAPLLAETAMRVQVTLSKDLGVELPKPLHVDVVRDQFSLAAMTGLPEKAASTTGTVAVAKWGRVTMVSPRATDRGYPWLDTLAHEMTHLALSRGTRDKAPLWLQEGVAKREETRWRDPEPLDDVPSIDAVAATGLDKGLGRPLDKLGPSIAMLPTAEQAQVAFAEVQSFVRYYIHEEGEDALVKLVPKIKDNDGEDGLERAITSLTNLDFVGWDKKWRAHIAEAPHELPPDMAPGAEFPHAHDIARRVRLGELLHGKGHDAAAAIEHDKAHALAPFDASIRAFLAEALLGSGEKDKATELVARPEDVHGSWARFWSLHGFLALDSGEAEKGFSIGIAIDPFDLNVGCEEKLSPELPDNPLRAAICTAARDYPPAP